MFQKYCLLITGVVSNWVNLFTKVLCMMKQKQRALVEGFSTNVRSSGGHFAWYCSTLVFLSHLNTWTMNKSIAPKCIILLECSDTGWVPTEQLRSVGGRERWEWGWGRWWNRSRRIEKEKEGIERMQIWQGGGVGIRDGRGGAFSSRAGRGEKARKSTDPKLRQKCVNCYSDICSALWCFDKGKQFILSS